LGIVVTYESLRQQVLAMGRCLGFGRHSTR
jgi:hypothetical protein